MNGLVQPPFPRFSGITGVGGGGGGGGTGTLVTLVTAAPVAIGSVVSLDAAGEAQLADASLALTPSRYNAIGVAKTAGAAGASIKFYTDMISVAPMLFSAVPLAANNGQRVYLSATPGEATLTAPGVGHALVLLGILKGADGLTTTPDVLLQFQVVALDT
jgi:hypothetical protein